ncbi:UNVERIFIED_ORG: hypothetical protein BDK47_10817 [Anoxybacillus amylolyticus]
MLFTLQGMLSDRNTQYVGRMDLNREFIYTLMEPKQPLK